MRPYMFRPDDDRAVTVQPCWIPGRAYARPGIKNAPGRERVQRPGFAADQRSECILSRKSFTPLTAPASDAT